MRVVRDVVELDDRCADDLQSVRDRRSGERQYVCASFPAAVVAYAGASVQQRPGNGRRRVAGVIDERGVALRGLVLGEQSIRMQVTHLLSARRWPGRVFTPFASA